MNSTTASETWTQTGDLAALRERLVGFALARTIVVIRYRWRDDVFRPLLVGKLVLIQTSTVGILPSMRSELRFVPVESIISVEPLSSRRRRPETDPP